MPDVISMSANVAVSGGPAVGFSSSVTVTGYDVTTVAVDAASNGTAAEATAAIQPGTTEEIRVLTITASRYDPADLTYDLGGVEDVALDGPHVFTSPGMLPPFTDPATSITVHNATAEAVTITVLVGRVPPPSP